MAPQQISNVQERSAKRTESIPPAVPGVDVNIPETAEAGNALSFSAETDPAGVPVLDYRWDFGEGTCSVRLSIRSAGWLEKSVLRRYPNPMPIPFLPALPGQALLRNESLQDYRRIRRQTNLPRMRRSRTNT
jgi:hypothetical protein